MNRRLGESSASFPMRGPVPFVLYGMRRLVTVPPEPLARFRLLAVWFATLVAFLNAGLLLFYGSLPLPLATPVRVAVASAAALLGVWWLYGYRRGGYQPAGWFVDVALVGMSAALSPMPAHAIALFFGGIQLRALFVPRRQLPVLIASYGIVRLASVTLVYSHGGLALGPITASALFSVFGLTMLAIGLHLFADASERQVATARALARSEERYRLVARATRDVVYDLQVATGRIEWTDSIETVFGYVGEQMRNVEWWLELVHPDDLDALRRSIAAVLSDVGQSVGSTIHYRVRRADGRYAHVSGSMLVQRAPDGTPERVIGSIRDVTSEHVLEERLRQAQKMEAVGQLAGGVAHDFNNLLTVIGGHVYMLETAVGARDATVVRHLDGITRAADRAAALTKQLLAFGRKQLLSPQVLDLNEVVDEVLQMMRPALGEQITIVSRLEPSLRPIHADAGQIGQVLLNLALNARDAISSQRDGRGTLTVETANAVVTEWDRDGDAEAAGPRAAGSPPALATGEYVRLTVRDTGIGMGPQTVARAFEPFFTTKPHGQGTGLGLATVYGIVKQSFGDIQVESAPGSGSTFTIHLPIAVVDRRTRPTPARATVQLLHSATPAFAGPTPRLDRGVLLVEDDDGVREFASTVLTGAGCTVYTARQGIEALERIRECGAAIELVVTDVVMPEMGGPELVEQLRAQRPGLPVLYITGYSDDPRMLAELEAAGARLLAKPFTAAALVQAVGSLSQLEIKRVARAS
ncbi:MAG TPA: ATP-binding protein [Gemmatimonadaceae bacterium]|jgi:two-component system, cell cycle sensor histidine kinase and response regulator CckA|nr:ATP-binding protein [Gemmatimonadaceae bacterium]